MSQLEFVSENFFPDCVFLKLHGDNVKPENISQLIEVSQAQTASALSKIFPIELKVTLRFGRALIKVPGGQVRVGLRRGNLKLKLINGKMPVEKMKLVAHFCKTVKHQDTNEKGLNIEGNLTISGGIKTGKIDKRTHTSIYDEYTFDNGGTEEQPLWSFEAKAGDPPILKGQLIEEPLGTVKKSGTPCTIEASFTAPFQRDLWLEGEGLWAKDLSRNKLAVIERAFFLRIIQPKLDPHLSKAEGEL